MLFLPGLPFRVSDSLSIVGGVGGALIGGLGGGFGGAGTVETGTKVADAATKSRQTAAAAKIAEAAKKASALKVG